MENAKGRGLLLKKYAVATPPETSPLDFGAVWLWALARDRFRSAVKTLHFHHAQEHLQVVAEVLHGVGTEAAKAWLKATLHQLRQGHEARVIKKLEKLLNPAIPTSRSS